MLCREESLERLEDLFLHGEKLTIEEDMVSPDLTVAVSYSLTRSASHWCCVFVREVVVQMACM